MTLKHSPATPLPWHYEQHNGDRPSLYLGKPSYQPAYIYSGDIRICGFQHMPNDAAYIAHACNKYPELVAALRDLRRDETLDDDDARLVNTRAKVDALLRSLGEL